MRSLLIAIYELGVEDVLIIGHTDCGVQHMNAQEMLAKMKQRGIQPETMETMKYCGIDFDCWLSGFFDVHESVRSSVNLLQEHPLIPDDINIYGFVMDSSTGELIAI